MTIKQIFIAAATVIAGAMATSCGNGNGDKQANDTLMSRAYNDSLSVAYGTMAGYYMNSELAQYVNNTGKDYDRQAFYNGLASVLDQEQPDEYLAGVNSALRIMEDIRKMEAVGAKVNRKALLKNINLALMSDSCSTDQVNKAAEQYDSIVNIANKRAEQRSIRRIAESPEAVTNAKSAQAYIDKQMAGDPDLKRTDSGLVYKIINLGTGATVGRNDMATVNYTLTHLDGKLIDQGTDKSMIPGNKLIPGFAQGLMMLAKGGKALLYVPADLAYGVQGVPQAGIEPGEMLLFHVEVTDITPNVLPE